jgi:hypothetical protein
MCTHQTNQSIIEPTAVKKTRRAAMAPAVAVSDMLIACV